MSATETPTAKTPAETKPAKGGWLAGVSAALGLISTGIGIYVAIGNYAIQQEAAAQKVRIEAADELLRERADVRAESTTERDYIIKVYDKVSDALQSTDERRHRVALALIETLPDPDLRIRLGQAFLQLGNNVSAAVTAQAERITQEAQVASAVEKTVSPGWSYVVFWCTANVSNRDLAATVFGALSKGAMPGQIRLRQLAQAENPNNITGLQIRTADPQSDQAAAIKQLLEKTIGKTFIVAQATNRSPNHLNVDVCQ